MNKLVPLAKMLPTNGTIGEPRTHAIHVCGGNKFPMDEALPEVLGIQGEGLFIFRDLGRRVIYLQGFLEKAY